MFNYFFQEKKHESIQFKYWFSLLDNFNIYATTDFGTLGFRSTHIARLFGALCEKGRGYSGFHKL